MSKEKGRVSVSINELLRSKEWDEARKRMKLLRSPETLGTALGACIRNPQVPKDVIKTLCQKIRLARTGHGSPSFRFETDRMCELGGCSGSEKDMEFGWFRIGRHAALSTLEALYEELGNIPGLMLKKSLHKILSSLWKDYLEATHPVGGAFCASAERERELLSVGSLAELQQTKHLKELWERTEILLKIVASGSMSQPACAATSEQREVLTIHSAVQYNAPEIVIWFGLRLYPEAAFTRDHRGRLPLHYAASLTNENTMGIRFRDIPIEERENSKMQWVLDCYPNAAKCLDGNGRLPLTLLLEVRVEGFSRLHYVNYAEKVNMSKIQAFVQAAPEALATRDRQSGFYPFMMTACAPLDVTYFLLRENPAVLSTFITHPFETYFEMNIRKLMRKQKFNAEAELSKAKTELEQMRQENALLRKENERLTREQEQAQHKNSVMKRAAPAQDDCMNKKACG